MPARVREGEGGEEGARRAGGLYISHHGTINLQWVAASCDGLVCGGASSQSDAQNRARGSRLQSNGFTVLRDARGRPDDEDANE